MHLNFSICLSFSVCVFHRAKQAFLDQVKSSISCLQPLLCQRPQNWVVQPSWHFQLSCTKGGARTLGDRTLNQQERKSVRDDQMLYDTRSRSGEHLEYQTAKEQNGKREKKLFASFLEHDQRNSNPDQALLEQLIILIATRLHPPVPAPAPMPVHSPPCYHIMQSLENSALGWAMNASMN
ncbi:alpha-crystallin A chain isoform X1 [Trachemys scripta elegans]|uniref:alpha-crystallin A chain isoform X1 n=1 Tax=Trachemys scripta elegans TaxID=31138 RepID=UPI001556B613|nr:alpha-crystallin A chain isoform X1 [Trachemys scripta elegans]